MPELEIRAATAADVDAVHRLESEAFPAPWRREFFAGELQAPGRFCLVAYRGGDLVGYVFSMTLLDEMHVNKIAVTETERRGGIATGLMARCFDFARQHGVETISLEVRQSNSGAQRFYDRLGFERTYIRPRYYPDGEAAVVMMKRVLRTED